MDKESLDPALFAGNGTEEETKFETKYIDVRGVGSQSLDDLLKPAVTEIQAGNVVAFPTETVYGAGANALSSEAVKRIFQAKRRPSDNPLIVHISNMEMLKRIINELSPLFSSSVMETAMKLGEKFWPGPMTILFPRNEKVPDTVAAGLPTVAVRMPSHPVALRLIQLADVPVAAPSANISGRPSPTEAKHVLSDLNGRIPVIVDGGPCCVGLESTVISLHTSPPLILRPGGVTLEQLIPLVPGIRLFDSHQDGQLFQKAAPPTPGLKYRHYSPAAPVHILSFPSKKVSESIGEDGMKKCVMKAVSAIQEIVKNGKKVGLIRTLEKVKYPENSLDEVILHPLASDQVAQGIFGSLRELDEIVDVIFVEGVEECDVGTAVMNRLRKASSSTIVLSEEG